MAIPRGQIGVGGLIVPTYLDAAGNTGKVARREDIQGLDDAVPTYYARPVVYDPVAGNLELMGTPGNTATTAEFYLILPADLDRSAADLTMSEKGSTARGLYMPSGVRARARDLSRGCLHIVLRHFSGMGVPIYTLADMPGPRPQDYDIVVARTYSPFSTFPADLAAGTRYPTALVVSPPYAAGETPPAGQLVGPTHNLIAYGVPADTPDILDVQPLDHTIHSASPQALAYMVSRSAAADVVSINGVSYKWWTGGPWVEGRTFRVTFDYDNY